MRLHYLLSLTCLSLGCTAPASAEGLSKQALSKLSQSIEFEYQERMKVCDTLNWNASDVCEVQAYHKKLVDQAELHANAHPTAKTRHAALIAHADATYAVAMTECNDVATETRHTCWENATSERENGKQAAMRLGEMRTP